MAFNSQSIISKHLAEIGRRGGESTSPTKSAAARENGKLGGRPPKNDGVARRPRRKKVSA